MAKALKINIKKQTLINIAEELFLRKGYQQTNIVDIINAAGVAQGTFYYYFSSKEDIVDAIVAGGFSEIRQAYYEVVAKQRLDALGKLSLIRTLTTARSKGKGRLLLARLYQENQHHIIDMIRRQQDQYSMPLYVEIFEEGNQYGEFHIAYPKEAAEFLLAMMHYIAEANYIGDKEAFKHKLTIVENQTKKLLGLSEDNFDDALLKSIFY